MRTGWLASIAPLALLLVFPDRSAAGPPLLCHSVDIGETESLPWTNQGLGGEASGYELGGLVEDTLRLLQPETPVLVRMETLRRATLYSQERKGAIAATVASALGRQNALSERLYAAVSARVPREPSPAGALALFDAGYLAECLKQAYWKDRSASWANRDGAALIQQALLLRGNDPAIEFALALVLKHGPREEYARRLDRAEKGAPAGSLVARNVARHREVWRNER